MPWIGQTSNSMCPRLTIRFVTEIVAVLAAAAFQGSLWGQAIGRRKPCCSTILDLPRSTTLEQGVQVTSG